MCLPNSSFPWGFSSSDLNSGLGCTLIIRSGAWLVGDEEGPKSRWSDDVLLVLVLVLLREPVLTVLVERIKGALNEECTWWCWLRLLSRWWSWLLFNPDILSFLCWVDGRYTDMLPGLGATLGPSVYSLVALIIRIWSSDNTWTCCACTSLGSGSMCCLPLSRSNCSRAGEPLPFWVRVSIRTMKSGHSSRLRTHLKSVAAALLGLSLSPLAVCVQLRAESSTRTKKEIGCGSKLWRRSAGAIC